MPESDAVVRALLAIVSDGSDERVLAQRICRACIEGLDVDGAVISVLTASVSRETLWASDATAQRLEELAVQFGRGCLHAGREDRGAGAWCRTCATAPRWPGAPIFAAAVAEQTMVRALFALPLQWGVINLGVLDLYRTTPGGLSQAQWRDALSAADIAALMMLTLRTDPDNPGNLYGVSGADGISCGSGLAGLLAGQPHGDPPGNRHGAGPARHHRSRSAGQATGPCVRRETAASRRCTRCGGSTAGIHRGYEVAVWSAREERS